MKVFSLRILTLFLVTILVLYVTVSCSNGKITTQNAGENENVSDSYENVTAAQTTITTDLDKTYFVSNTGDDTAGDGTIDRPWKTIAKASGVMKAGDTL
jgi:hypothetical protein